MLRDDIKAATITAMKAGDKETTAALRLIGAKIKDRDIELRTGTAPTDDDAMVVEVLQKMAKHSASFLSWVSLHVGRWVSDCFFKNLLSKLTTMVICASFYTLTRVLR